MSPFYPGDQLPACNTLRTGNGKIIEYMERELCRRDFIYAGLWWTLPAPIGKFLQLFFCASGFYIHCLICLVFYKAGYSKCVRFLAGTLPEEHSLYFATDGNRDSVKYHIRIQSSLGSVRGNADLLCRIDHIHCCQHQVHPSPLRYG